MADESIIANLKSEGFKELINDLGLSAKGFSLLDKSIEDAQKKLATLDKTSQEFKDLTKEINAATIAANAYSESTDTLKKELRDTTNDIGQLEKAIKALDKAGEQNSQTYKDLVKQQDTLKKKAGELKDTVGDLNAEIKNSGSDTKNLDKALRAVNTVAAGYQAAQGALVLFGGENKKFEQTLLKLNAVMAITQGLQQIQEELSKKDSIFTMAAAKAKQFYATAMLGATRATQLFYGVLSGGLLIALGLVVTYWKEISEALGIATQSTEELAAATEKLRKAEEDRKILMDAELRYLKAKGASQDEIIAKELQIAEIELKKLQTIIKISKFRFIDPNDPNAPEQRKKALAESLEVDKAFQAQLLDAESKILEIKKKAKADNDALDADKKAKDNFQDSKRNLEIVLKQLDDENKLRNKFRKQREKEEELSKQNEIQLLDDRNAIFNDINKKGADERLAKNKALQDELAEQNKRRQEEDELAEQKHAEKIAFILQTLAGVADAIGNIASQSITIRQERELQSLEEKKKKGLITEKQFEKESAKIKTEAAKKQRAADIAIAIAKIPLIFLQALVSAPPPFGLIIAAIASGLALAQVGILAASPLPQFKEGGQVSKKLGLIKGRSHSEGGVPIEVEGDEYVMPVEQTKENLPVLEAIHKGTFHKLFVPKDTIMQPDVFANIPNPANLGLPVTFDKDDYSSINQRLDKLANEMWWLGQYTKEGNKDRNRTAGVLVSKLSSRKSNPNL